MAANPIESIGGLSSAADVSKPEFVAWAKARVPQVMASAAEVNNTDLSGQFAIYVLTLRDIFELDTSDTTTADDGTTCLIDSEGNRFKLPASNYAISSTDNAVVRFNGTTGGTQNSGVTIDDSNNVVIPGYLRPGGIYYDDTGGYIDRGAIITLARGLVDNPGTIKPAFYNIAGVKSDNATFQGASGGYIKTYDAPGITSGERGVLYGLQLSVQPNFDRNNYPYDDADCLVLQNEGTGRGTEAIYFGHNAALTQGDFLACLGFDMWAVAGIYYTGHYTHGINANWGGGTTVFANSMIYGPNNQTLLSANNAAGTEVALLKFNSSNKLLIGNGKLSLDPSTGDLIPGASASYNLGTAAQQWGIINSALFTTNNGTHNWSWGGVSNLAFAYDGTARLTIATDGSGLTAAAYNKVAITAPASQATLTLGSGKTVTINNTLTVSGTDGTTMTMPGSNATLAGLGVAQAWSAVQSFDDGNFALKGATSGALTLKAAGVAGTNTLTLPAGTTDFSATGGTSKFVRQNAAGGAFDVVRLALADLSNFTDWSTWAPTLSNYGGTSVTQTLVSARYIKIGTMVLGVMVTRVTATSGAINGITFTLPTTPAQNSTGNGRETVGGNSLNATIVASDATAIVTGYNGGWVGPSGAGLSAYWTVHFMYESN